MPDLDQLTPFDAPDVDVDAMFARIQRRLVRRRRTRRAVTAVVAAVAAIVASAALLTGGADGGALVDTAGDGQPVGDLPSRPASPGTPMLPEWVPDGATLRWVDVYEDGQVSVWHDMATPALALGYDSPESDFVVRVFPGARLDVDVVRRDWGDGAYVVDDTPGKTVVTEDEWQTVVALEGGVAEVTLMPFEGAGPVDLEDQVAVARSLRPVSLEVWIERVQRADVVAPPFGLRRESVLVEGDGWDLMGFLFRGIGAPGQHSYAVRFDDEALAPSDGGNSRISWSEDDLDGTVQVVITEHDGRTIAWGVAPNGGSIRVDLWFPDQTVTAYAIPFGQEAFAIELPAGTVEPPLMAVAYDADDVETARTVDDSDRNCARRARAGQQVVVPDVVGLSLREALTAVHAAGLGTSGVGVVDGDPASAEAVVTSQAPGAGERVATPACIGFRTR